MKGLSSLEHFDGSQLDIKSYIIILAVAFILSFILSWFISNQSRLKSTSSRYKFVFPVLIPVMVLIISVIKSSIALSLGLVGALSIVRFRTPIKEAEELVYIFLALAIGIGLGANYVVMTVVTFLLILLVLKIALTVYSKRGDGKGFFLEITNSDSKSANVEAFNKDLEKMVPDFSLKRVEANDEFSSFSYFLSNLNDVDAAEIIKKLKQKHPKAQMLIFKKSEDYA